MKKLISIVLLVLGTMIVIATYNPLYLIHKEKQIHRSLDKKYKVTNQDMVTNRLELRNHIIEVLEERQENRVTLQVLLNNETLTEPMTVSAADHGATSFGAWIHVFKIHHRNESMKTDVIAIVQTFPNQKAWNIFYVDPLKQVTTKQITLGGRSKDYLDMMIIRSSSNLMMGYYSDIQYASGNPFATLVPAFIFIIGLIMMVIGAILLLINKLRER
ncbi:MAG: hypothetical protein ACE3L7_14225 [Candidatus Pristimantibacillus sp.]